MTISADFRRQLEGYGLLTAEILYRLPDHPKLLQSFIWQTFDLAPEFPELKKFLDFWQRDLEGPLYSVRLAHRHLIKPTEWRLVDGELTLH
ncbi:usg protein [Stappia sp. F7233]|uniref:Usg protein n=1 Tax=Stappia albiluteola TaxID=2758565 RepID=A0A839AGH7_9HYPH|nr:usg protein [Stappia albiluteola]MBA5777649.1 usg protein [Stappia albiluteola]